MLSWRWYRVAVDEIQTHDLTTASNNNNNNNQDNIYSAVIMTEVIARVHSVHLVNVEQRQAATDPQTKPPDLGCESGCFRQLSSTTTIADDKISRFPIQHEHLA